MKNQSKKDERMMVLEMVSEGKISVDESVKLLELLSEPNRANNWYDECNYSSDYDFEDKMNRFSKSVDDFAKDVSYKLQDAYKGVEPKVKSATKTVVQKTVTVLDDISKSLNETLKNMSENENNNGDSDLRYTGEDKKEEDNTPKPN